MKDLQGRNYALVSEVHEGTVLINDGNFTCLHEGHKSTVKKDDTGLFVDCDEGSHYLDGQIKGEGNNTYYLGFYKET